jgi:predicted permease
MFIRTLGNLHNGSTGYNRSGLLVMQLFPQPGRERIPNRAIYYKELLDKMMQLPGVTGASYSYYEPVTSVDFREAVSAQGSASAPVDSVEGMIGPGFIRLMGMRILAGREFTWQDDEHSPKVALVSESLARKLFGDHNPLGETISMANRPELTGAQIVGVVSNASLWRVDSHNPPAVYAAMLQNAAYNYGLLDIRTAGDPLALAKPAEAALRSMGHHYSLRTQSLRERLDMFLTDQRMLALLSGFFGALALILVGIGLYGLLAESVASRTAEIGIRMAIGAQRGDVLRMFLFDAARLTAIGLIAGTASALVASRFVSSMLFGVSPSSFSAIALPCTVLSAAALIATYVPARRASKTEPIKALRAE